MFSLFLALKYLKPKRGIASLVTILSVLGVMLGVAIILIVRGVFTGFGDAWESKILSFKPHIVVRSATRGTLQNADELCRSFDEIPGVVACSPSIETRVLVEHDKYILAPVLLGTDAERIRKLLPLSMGMGKFDLSGDSVVIGIDMAQQLGLAVGDELLVYSPMNLINKDEIYFPERLTVSGIYMSGQADFDSGYVFVSLPVARDLAGVKYGANSISLRVANPQDHDSFSKIVSTVQLKSGYTRSVQTWQELDRLIFNAVATEKNMMMLLLMFISIVAIFCVVNTIIVITVQKTNEIGMLKSLGFSTRQLTTTFVLYGFIQCVLGTALGVGLAYLVLFNLQRIIDFLGRLGMDVFPKAVYGLDQLPWRVEMMDVVQVIGVVVVFCGVASLLPAWRAAALDPVEALRKE